MIADTKFNVRHGMTTGSGDDKHDVLDSSGGLSATNLEVDAYQTGGQILSGGQDLLDIFSSGELSISMMERMYTQARELYFNKLIYTSDQTLVGVEVYQDDTEAVKLFTRELDYDYTSGITLTAITTTEESSNSTWTKTLNYDTITGSLTSIERQFVDNT